jgi:hypothetical protein
MEERSEKRHEADDRQANRTEHGKSITGTDSPEELQEADGEKEDWDGDFFQTRVVFAACGIIQNLAQS